MDAIPTVIPGFAGPRSGIPGMQSTQDPVTAAAFIAVPTFMPPAA